MSEELIARLEKLGSSSVALDREIHIVAGRLMHRGTDAPPYTRSIDAALTLMPDNTGVILYCILGKKPSVSIRRYEWDYVCNADTAALAICIAALTARAASPKQPGEK